MRPTRAHTFIALVAIATTFGFSLTARAADAKPADHKIKVLYLDESKGFRHQPVTRKGDELASSEKAMIDIGKQSGQFECEPTQDARVITADKLKSIDVLAFYTTGAFSISDESWAAVQEWIQSGKGGFIGIHSATDTQWNYKGQGMDYTHFINGQFAGHPWGQGTPIKVTSHEPNHPTVKMWGPSFDYKEEIYQYQKYDPKAVRVLQSLDFEGTPLKKPYHVPLTWVREIGKGRLFYSNLGHTPSTWDDPKFREMIVESVKWVTHQIDGPAEPNPEVQAAWTIHSFLAYGDDGKGAAAGAPKASEVAAKLQKTGDNAWLVATAEKVTQLRGMAPPDLREPKAPNKANEAKDPKKYQEDLAKFEKDMASYQRDLPKNREAAEKYSAARKTLVDEIMKKAAATTASR